MVLIRTKNVKEALRRKYVVNSGEYNNNLHYITFIWQTLLSKANVQKVHFMVIDNCLTQVQ
uniref:Uncharacterized protein n=1 Tax=Anguilla anguilla TaxID=7936 RepID=A0A0E9UD44_ANGAN